MHLYNCHKQKQQQLCPDMEQASRERHVNTGNVMRAIETKLSTHCESQWKEKLQAEFAVRGKRLYYCP